MLRFRPGSRGALTAPSTGSRASPVPATVPHGALLRVRRPFFGASLLAATLLPAQSEVVLFGMLLTEHYKTWLLVLVASIGNISGSCVNWLFGRLLAHFEGRRWFPLKREATARAEGWYQRYGRWSLLLSWGPIVPQRAP